MMDGHHLGQGRGALARGPALVGDVGGRGGEGEEAEAAHHHRQVGPGHGLAPQHGPATWPPHHLIMAPGQASISPVRLVLGHQLGGSEAKRNDSFE